MCTLAAKFFSKREQVVALLSCVDTSILSVLPAPIVSMSDRAPEQASTSKDQVSHGRTSQERKSPGPSPEGLLPAQHWTQLEEVRDEDADDTDSALGDNASSTASLTSSILEYRTILGRSFHSERGNAQYWGSIDAEQNEAMDINHHVQTLLLDGKLHLAPLDNVERVVDIGTGTGLWAIDFADEHPNATIIGTDVSPIQPSWVPPNVQFQIDDCTQEWTFAENSMDYVHMRWLVGSIQDWTALLKQAYRCLKPGGYIESHETSANILSDDGSVHDQTAMGQWGKIFIEGGRKLGRPFTVVEDAIQEKAMEAAGFVDIRATSLKCPIGAWPKDERLREVGKYMYLALTEDIEGSVVFMANLLGWKKEEVFVYAAHLRRELASNKFHPYYRQSILVARKPESSSR
ncbi:S-adenosyl-L-methionine-dependent methyltransferase [Durotheca rogersii]|uniref:S-adenosyl-L-methionine-dependent methyltransferase n=1 Tax=Durotheca rogersii TaxID=419775 RepID=UPI00221F014B|nr:S-adenosyl-L-methionine-dependent methyltransferase [Durotheca rogersii]KAI5861441.1 S-adenosyl-L-methionine-dependent methyltransferase [Durotheca rogersii]